MTIKQGKYIGFMVFFGIMLVTDKVFDLWHGWYLIDTLCLGYSLWQFIEVSEDNANTDNNN